MGVGMWNVDCHFHIPQCTCKLAQQVSALYWYTRDFASHQRSSHEKTKQLRTHVCMLCMLLPLPIGKGKGKTYEIPKKLG